MKVGNTNLDIVLNNNSTSNKLFLLEDDNTKPIKKDEIKIKNTTNIIPAQAINLNSSSDSNNKKNETVIDVAIEIKEQFDDVPMDKKINLADGVLSIIPGRDITRISTNYMMISERKKKIDKSLDEKNPKEALAQTIFTAKNTWAVINNSVKLANYIAEESHSLGKISKSKLAHFEKGTNKVSNINNALVLPFAIADFAYSYDSMSSYKSEIKQKESTIKEKDLQVMKNTYKAKQVTFGLSALSLAALSSSIVFKSSNATTVVFIADVSQKFSRFLEDEKARQSVKDSYNILRAKF